jgi:hypothetical protein
VKLHSKFFGSCRGCELPLTLMPPFVSQKLLMRNLALKTDGVNGNVRTCLNREILCL